MLKTKNVTVIDCSDWDNLVRKVYQKPYCFQQQDGCKERGVAYLTVPAENNDEYMNDSIPEVVNGSEIGVKFDVWLARDPNQLLKDEPDCSAFDIQLFWGRSFYPDLQTIANDLHKKGMVDAGEYMINIDW